MVMATRHGFLVMLVLVASTAGCASNRSIELTGEPIQLNDGESFYIVVPEMTTRVVYDLLPHPIDFSKNADRKDVPGKPDVPEQISVYLQVQRENSRSGSRSGGVRFI